MQYVQQQSVSSTVSLIIDQSMALSNLADIPPLLHGDNQLKLDFRVTSFVALDQPDSGSCFYCPSTKLITDCISN